MQAMYLRVFINIVVLVCSVFGLFENSANYKIPPECVEIDEDVSEKMVMDNFFQYHSPLYRPIVNANKAVLVDVSFVLTSIVEIRERQRMLDIAGYFVILWWDEYHIWNTTFPINCIQYLVLPAVEIWLPNLAIINAESHYAITMLQDERIRIYSNGLVSYTPGGSFSVYCNYDLSMFPFDIQTCPISVESWKYTNRYMRVVASKNVTIIDYKEHQQWSLINTFYKSNSITYTENWNQYERVEFYLVIQRKTLYYTMNVILPSITIALAQLATFTLPLAEIEKIGISFTCLLSYSVFKLMVVGDMPRSSDNIPILSAFIDLMMTYIALSMLGEGFSFMALNRIDLTGTTRVPSPVLTVFTKISCLLCVEPPADDSKRIVADQSGAAENVPNDEAIELEQIQAAIEKTNIDNWRFIATVINRFVISCYITSVIITPLVMFVIIPNV